MRILSRRLLLAAALMVSGTVGSLSVAAQGATPTAAAAPKPAAIVIKPVAVLVDYKVLANGLAQTTALQRSTSLAHFKLKLPVSSAVPHGMRLQQINVQPHAGAYSPLLTFWYQPSATRFGFRLHEQVLGKSLFDKSGKAIAVGKTTYYVTTSMAYVYITWTDGTLLYSLDNVTTKSPDVNLNGLLSVAKNVK